MKKPFFVYVILMMSTIPSYCQIVTDTIKTDKVRQTLEIVENDSEIRPEEIESFESGYLIEDTDTFEDENYNQNEEEIYYFAVVEVKPEFPGGKEGLYNFVKEETKYPELAKENMIAGTVYVEFTIEKDGSVSNPKIMRPLYQPLDEAAINMIKKMPRWSPGKYMGETVRVSYIIPVKFKSS